MTGGLLRRLADLPAGTAYPGQRAGACERAARDIGAGRNASKPAWSRHGRTNYLTGPLALSLPDSIPNMEEPEMATVDDIFNLLTAVNETTLGRIESDQSHESDDPGPHRGRDP
jgi:hypothetical protein